MRFTKLFEDDYEPGVVFETSRAYSNDFELALYFAHDHYILQYAVFK